MGGLAVRDESETDAQLFHFEDGEYAGESMDEPSDCSVAGRVLICVYGNVPMLRMTACLKGCRVE